MCTDGWLVWRQSVSLGEPKPSVEGRWGRQLGVFGPSWHRRRLPDVVCCPACLFAIHLRGTATRGRTGRRPEDASIISSRLGQTLAAPNPHVWLPVQVLNPSETFGGIIVDYNHVECSSACITGLTAFSRRFPEHRAGEIAKALKRGIAYIKRCEGSALCLVLSCTCFFPTPERRAGEVAKALSRCLAYLPSCGPLVKEGMHTSLPASTSAATSCSVSCHLASLPAAPSGPATPVYGQLLIICLGRSFDKPAPPSECSIQRPDGSWYGNWAVCFTYGTWFGCEALAAMGEGWVSELGARAG